MEYSVRAAFICADKKAPSRRVRNWLAGLPDTFQALVLPFPRSIFKRLAMSPVWAGFDVVCVPDLFLSARDLRYIRRKSKTLIFDLDRYPENPEEHKRLLKMSEVADAFFCANNFLVEKIKESASPNQNVYEIPPCVRSDKASDAKEGPGDDRIRIGWVFREEDRGALEAVLPVLVNLNERYGNLELVVIGSAGFEFEGIDVVGSGETDIERPEVLHSLNFAILPSLQDDFHRGLARPEIVDCMAAGIPLAVTPVEAVREFVHDGVNGFYVYDAHTWAMRLDRLIIDRDLCRQLGDGGRKMAQEKYSFEKVCAVLAESIINVIKK